MSATPMRYRSEGGMVQQSPLQIWTRASPTASWVGGAILPTIQTGFFNEITDVVIPNYRKLVNNGEVFFNSYRSSKWACASASGQGYEQINKSAPYNSVKVEGDWLGYTMCQGAALNPFALSGLFGTEITRMMEEVSTRVLANRGMADFGLPEDLAEYKQTLKIVSDFNRKVNLYIPWRMLRAPKDVMAAWLMFRYGLKPLASDVVALLKAVTKPRRSRRITTRDSLSDSRTSTTIDLKQGSGSIGTYIQHVRKHELVIRGMSLDEALAPRLGQLGVTFKSVATLPWELLYASFVADWFFNLGDYIKAYVPAVGFNQLGSTLSITDTRSDDVTITSNFDGTKFKIVRPCSGELHATRIIKYRNGLLSPALGVNHTFGLHGARLGDALALTGQRILSAFTKIR